MNAEQLAALLGRSLTGAEVTNLSLLLQVALSQVEDLICSPLVDRTEVKTYIARDGFRTVNTDILETIVSVTVDGTARTDYQLHRHNSLNSTWYNAVVFDTPLNGGSVVSIEADYGFTTLPADLLLLQANLFEVGSKNRAGTDRITSKRVEDFSINFSSDSEEVSFLEKNARTLRKYSCCNQVEVISGESYGLVL